MLVLVGVIFGFLVMQARGSDDTNDNAVATVDRESNCSPIARGDAAATRPGETVLVDVLANDTDADEDQLVFQILKTEGGTAEIDDADTPTDSSDDRLAFTPADPPVDPATVEYQALDPQGGFSTSSVTIAVNPSALLPDGVRSALATDPAAEGTESGRCGETVDTTTSTSFEVGPVGPETEAVVPTTIAEDDEPTGTTVRRRTATTRRSGASPSRTTTTRRSSSGGGSPNNTSRPSDSPNTTDAPSVTAPGDGGGNPTTTSPPPTSPGTTAAPPPAGSCGSPNPQHPQYNPDFEDCIRGGGG